MTLTPTLGDLPTDDQAVTLSLFDDLPPARDKGYRAVLVRPHMRRMAGDPDASRKDAPRPRKAPGSPRPRTATLETDPAPRALAEPTASSRTTTTARTDHFVGVNKMVDTSPPLHCNPPHNGTSTSRTAAAVVAESGVGSTYRERVLACIRQAGERGITRADIEARTGLPGNTIRPRVYELMGRQRDSEGSYPAPLIEETEEVRIPDCGGKVRQKVLRAL